MSFWGSEEQERERLKYIVGSLVPFALDEGDLVARAVERFVGKACSDSIVVGADAEEPHPR